jgi:P4 family phage/plasmid primase-like protien
MIEIRRIREYVIQGKTRKADKPFEPALFVDSLNNLFDKNLPEIIEKIPENERYNCYYTLGHAPDISDTKSRKWSHQDVIPFDIDNCEYIDEKPNAAYLDAIAEALNVDIKKCVVIATGNGLQVLVKPKFIINDSKFFELNQKHYSALCLRVADCLKARSLKGEPDASAFQPNRLFRLPLTLNVKPKKPKRTATIISGNLEPIEFDLAKASGLPVVTDSDCISEKELSYFKIDTAAVESGCDFLKYAKDNQKTISEPQWYALLSIVGRLSNGSEKAHLYSKGHPNYTAHDTDLKLKQSLESSGPRTCENINTLWGKCKECPNYKRVTSPVSIKSENFIATEDTGFHALNPKTGKVVPQYSDLQKYYARSNPYVNFYRSHYIYTGKYFVEKHDETIPAFAQDNFRPSCDNNKASEFSGLIKRTNIVDHDFFSISTRRKINLLNGVLNIETMLLEPHSPHMGFKYCLPFNYDPIADAPLFKKLLNDVTCNDENLQKILLEFMGFAISGDDTPADKFLLLSGEGANGKSTFLKILRALGGDGVRNMTEANIMNQFDSVALDGANFVILEEVPSHIDAVLWERLKGLVTGGTVRASKKGKDAYEFDCRAKFIVSANALPKGATPSHGLYRRFLIVPFNATFDPSLPGFDRNIASKIIANELPGVLNLALDAYTNLKANDFNYTHSEKVDQALRDYIIESDNVATWAEESVDYSPTAKTTTKEFYTSYVSFTEANGERPVSAKALTQRLRAWCKRKGIDAEYSRDKNSRIFLGVLLKKQADF